MKKVKGIPITGSTPEYSRKAPLVPNAKDTSADAQVMIGEAPMPFKNRMETPQIPAPAGPGTPGTGTTLSPGLRGTAAPMNPPGGPVGQKRMPNQSAQIGGRNGFPPGPRRIGPDIRGAGKRKHASFYGE